MGNPAEPLVRALRKEVGAEAADVVHHGATSQDVVDTAAMLVSRRALDLVLAELDRAAAAVATLAETHRATPMAGRTLLQQAVPTTFGLKAAGWLVAILEAQDGLERIRSERLAVQLGGAAGTLSALGEKGPEVLRLFARELELGEPVVPWHADRTRIAELGRALSTTAGSLAKIGLDVILLAQTEVGEVREATGGASSTMPHKRNPVGSVRARACARLVNGHASVLTASLEQEHERAAGAWQAEWPALSGALAYTGGAAAAIAGVAEGLEVDAERMRRNLELTHGAIVSERISFLLTERIGRERATALVGHALRRSEQSGRDLGEELAEDPDTGSTRTSWRRSSTRRRTWARPSSSSTACSSATGRAREPPPRAHRAGRRRGPRLLELDRDDDGALGPAAPSARGALPRPPLRPSRARRLGVRNRALTVEGMADEVLDLLDTLGVGRVLLVRALARRHGRHGACPPRSRAARPARPRVHRGLSRAARGMDERAAIVLADGLEASRTRSSPAGSPPASATSTPRRLGASGRCSSRRRETDTPPAAARSVAGTHATGSTRSRRRRSSSSARKTRRRRPSTPSRCGGIDGARIVMLPDAAHLANVEARRRSRGRCSTTWLFGEEVGR